MKYQYLDITVRPDRLKYRLKRTQVNHVAPKGALINLGAIKLDNSVVLSVTFGTNTQSKRPISFFIKPASCRS